MWSAITRGARLEPRTDAQVRDHYRRMVRPLDEADVQRLQDEMQQLDARLSALASEKSQLQAQLTTTHSQSSSGKDEVAAERAKAAEQAAKAKAQ